MSEENRKIVIVVGAGASCDFVVSEDKKFNENHGNIKYEIWGNSQTIADKNADKNAKYFLSEKNRNNYSFPSGEALIKMISNSRKVFDFFGNEILDEIFKDFCKKVDLNQITMSKLDEDCVRLSNYYFKFFFEYLKSPTKHKYFEKKNNIDVEFDIFQESLQNSIYRYKKSMEFGNFWEPLIPSLEFQDFKKLNNKFIEFREINLDEAIGFFMGKLEDCFEVRYDSKLQFLSNKSLKLDSPNFIEDKLQNLIFKISTSPYLLISRLVNYYQPFSIDELLDSIKTEKIDVFKPLELEPSELKSILKDSENKTENELENQFRNELINAGKTLIALFLLQSEKRDLFDNPNPQNDAKIWYRHIRNLIINSGKDSAEIKKQIQNLTIISFNYDRSLDYYLRTRLSDYYGEIKERVFYPYGKLAVDNWDCDDYGKYNKDGKFNPYNENELREIEELGQGLRVIGELDEDLSKSLKHTESYIRNISDFKYWEGNIENYETSLILGGDYISKLEELKKSEKDDKIKDEINFIIEKYKTLLALHESHKIYFLGFAFHQQNYDLLQLKNFRQNKEIYWTNYDASVVVDKKVDNIFRFLQVSKYGESNKSYPSNKKGVYDALMHDFKLGF